MSVTHPGTQPFSNGRAPPSFNLVLKWSVDIRLDIRFQSVGTQSVIQSFLNGRNKSGYTLVFKKPGHPVTHSLSNALGTLGYMLVFEWPCHTQLHTCFQMVGKHAVTHSFSNGQATSSFKLVLKWSVDIRLNIRFQSVGTNSVTRSF